MPGQSVSILLRRVRRRLLGQILVGMALRCLAVSLLAVAVWFVTQTIFFESVTAEWKWGVAGGVLGLGALTTILLAAWRAPSPLAAALALDTAFGLKERVTTLLTLSSEQEQSPVAQALRDDVGQRIAALELAGKFRPRVTWPQVAAPAAAFLLATAAFFFEPFWSSNRASADVSAILNSKNLKDSLDNLKKPLILRDDKLPKSEELKELDAAWDKLVKEPSPKNEEQVRDRIKEMRNLEERMKDRIQKMADKSKDVRDQLEKLTSDPKKAGTKEIKELQDALAKGKFDKAMDALDKLAKKLQNKELTKQNKENLAEQLKELQDKLERLAERKDQKDKLQREVDEGKITPEQMEREMERLAKESKNLKGLHDLAEMLGQCRSCLGDGGDGAAMDKLGLIKGLLKEIELNEKDLQALLDEQDRLEAARDALLECLNQCQGNCDADGEMNGLGKGRRPGTRRPIGKEPDGKVVGARQHATPDPKGQQRITGFTKGGVFSRIPARDVEGAFRQAVQDAPEAIERQRIPPDAADMVKGYFQKLGGQNP